MREASVYPLWDSDEGTLPIGAKTMRSNDNPLVDQFPNLFEHEPYR